MESIFKKYFFAFIWVILPIVLGVILNQYLKIAWILLISIGISVLLFFIYWFFYQKFKYFNLQLEILHNKIQNIQDALGTSDECIDKLSWSLFWSKVQQLAAKIEGSNFNPDIIISIGRSGAIVGGMIASIMGSIKHIGFDRIVNIIKKNGYPEERNIAIDNTIIPNVELLKSKHILCIMSECKTGNSLHVINKFFRTIPDIKIKTAVIFSKKNVICKPDFYVDFTEAQWPQLPFRIEEKWKDYYPRTVKEIKDTKNK